MEINCKGRVVKTKRKKSDESKKCDFCKKKKLF